MKVGTRAANLRSARKQSREWERERKAAERKAMFPQCTAITKKGNQCKKYSNTVDYTFCSIHETPFTWKTFTMAQEAKYIAQKLAAQHA